MYRPPHFAVDDLGPQHALIRDNPLGLLIVRARGGLSADPIPFVLDADRGSLGTLRCHVARANPVWRDHEPEADALVVFSAADRYITPSWYGTKRETGKVVPTWNYATVHAYGRIVVRDDAAWIADQVASLTDVHEARRPTPWAVTDAPESFVAAQMRGIVGLEIEIARIEGKWKVSQNRPEGDRRGVADGIDAENGAEAADPMAALVRAFGGL